MRQRIATLIAAVGAVITVACGQSDPGITTAVKARLAQDDTVKAYQIDVDTTDKVVTLSGSVDTPAAKEQAVVIARQTEGVRDVTDQITVDPQAAATAGREAGQAIREDAREAGETAREAAISAAVKGKFLTDTAVSGLKIDVDTNAGVVTLTGTATTRAEADRAVMLARETEGVMRVVDDIEISR